MAKKGGVQQLQADINTDEEFEKFLERLGLLVMDVYTEWCGPCIGMIGSLKKIKLELGGDNLQLAICKADTIEALSRFRNKSEPTWLFASNGKAVNILFGTNVPLLMKTIAHELELEAAYKNKKGPRTFYEITERQPIEQEIYDKFKSVEDKARLAEQHAAEAKRRTYLMFVTDEIMKNMADLGVTIFGPQITRDMYKKIMDPADTQKLSCKDRRVLQITPQDLEVLHFSCNNALPEEIWQHLLGKDLLTCLWKAPDGDTRPIEEILGKYVHDCIKPQTMVDDFGNVVPDQALPPLLPPLNIEIKDELEANEAEVKAPNEAEEEEEAEAPADDLLGGLLIDVDMPTTDGAEGEGEEGAVVQKKEALQPKDTTPKKFVTIPAVWAPGNRRTMAAAIYLFYRWHTGTFLPPDPVPEPPHLAIGFEAYKRKDITDACEKHKEDILAYGYFTTADPETAHLISNTTALYEKKPIQVTDKLVLKVAKKTSHALLTLAAFGPCYISANTVDGEKDCKKFFPEGYITEADAQKQAEEEEKGKKKKKKKKKAEEEAEETPKEAAEGGPESPGAAAEAGAEEDEEGKSKAPKDASAPPPEETEAQAQDHPIAGDEGEAEGEEGGEAAEPPKEAE